MKRSPLVFAVSVLLFISSSAWSSNKTDAPLPEPQAPPAANAGQTNDSLSGKVVETMNSGGYTYVSLENKGKKTWVAIPAMTVKVGQKMTCEPGVNMNNFTSKTLNRTFESIIFSGGCR